MNGFTLGTPTLVCRWRIYDKRLPMEHRHIRALSARVVNGAPVSVELAAWVKQHVEWTLADGAQANPNGVLMIAVDEEGRAAMSLGSYRPLERVAANDLLLRAQSSWREAEQTGVSPEDLWVVRGDALVWGTSPEFAPSGASSLIDDLARTLGMPVKRDEDLLASCAQRGIDADEVFLVSDEHGVVPSSNFAGQRSTKFAASYQKLLSADRLRLGA
ncbi:MAG: hypothetical protein Q4A01_02985 [Coriobacteriales bacterium]|nr:hypothetical protein [Coriobacteriales bacterium]